MFKKKEKTGEEQVAVKETKSKSKKPVKKSFIFGGIALAVVVVVVLVFVLRGGDDYLSITNKLLSQNTGSFRYVFDIRTDKATGDEPTEDASSLASLENIEASTDVDKILEEYKESEKKFVDWGNKEGVEVVDWKYPKYKIILEGNVVSVNPLELNITMSLATNYFNDKLTEIIVKDDKTYVNIEQLRYWLINSKDSNLIELGTSLPESAKYVTYKGDKFNLYSTFAEDNEVNASRETNIMKLYQRVITTLSTVQGNLSIDSKCLSTDSDIHKLNITGDNSVALLNSVRGIVQNVGGTYKASVENQYSNNLLTEDQYKQAKKETDNVVSAFSKLNTFVSSADLSSLNLQVSGNAREYIGGKGSTIYESSLAFQFTTNDTDYSVAIQLQKDMQAGEVKEPTQSTVDISSFEDSDFVEKYLLKVLNHLNISGVDLSKKLTVTPSTIKENAINDFVALVNKVNGEKEGFTELSASSVYDFIDGYRDFEISDKTSDLDNTNKTLVDDFLTEFGDLLPKEEETQDTDAGLKDVSRFPSLVAENKKFRIYADFDNDTSNTRCIQVKCYILNNSSKELKLKTSDFTLRSIQSSKYPANYESLLKEYDNEFNMKKAPKTITIPANGYIETPLYFVLSNGIEYMDLWYGEENLGVVIAR